MPHEVVPSAFESRPDDWSNYAVPMLARILADDLEPGFGRALAWGRIDSLMSAAMESLSMAMSALAEFWPVDVSEAAFRFAGEVSALRQQMKQVGDAAGANKSVVSRAVESFEMSRADILRLANEWAFNAVQERSSMLAGTALRGEYPEDWRDLLNQQAHMSLQASDFAVFEESRALCVPDSFRAGSLTFGGKFGIGVEPGNGTPNPGSGSTSDHYQSSGEAGVGGAPGDHLTNRKPTLPGTPPSRVGGVIGGVSPGVGIGAVVANSRSGPRSSMEHPRQPGAADPTSTYGPVHANDRAEHGVLGGMPMVGGVGGPPGGSGKPRRRGSSRTERWAVARGAPGVLLPGSGETKHDPGPGVIGIDR